MRTRLALAPAALLALAAFLPGRADDAADRHALFNGKDLTGWRVFLDPKAKGDARPEDVFRVKDGVLDCTGKPMGYLITEKEYGNYRLELEWRWPKKPGNSGVFVHVSGPDKIWPKGAEAQLWAGHAGDIWLVDGFKLTVDKDRQDPKTPRHFYRLHKDEKVEKKVGEWNKYVIHCKQGTITLEVNGVEVNSGRHAEAQRGKILLQSEGAPIQFRNIRLIPAR